MIMGTLSGVSYISAATFSRAVFGLIVSVVIISKIHSGVAVEVFQLLLLQSAFITMTSGSAYPRGAARGGNRREAVALLAAFVLVYLCVTVVLLGAEWFVVSPRFWHEYVSRESVYIYILLLGAGCTGLHTVFQGIMLNSIGIKRTFIPLIVSQVILSSIMISITVSNEIELILIFVSAQCLPLILYMAINFRYVAALLEKNSRPDFPIVLSYTVETLKFGFTTTLYLIGFFAVREYWSGQVSASVAAAVFFAIRISDLYMQVAYYALSSGRMGGELGVSATRLFGRLRLLAPAITLLLAIFAIVSTSVLVNVQFPIWAGLSFLLMQMCCDPLRCIGSIVTIAALRQENSRDYALLVIPGLALSMVASAVLSDFYPILSIYLFQIIYALTMALAWAGLRFSSSRILAR